MKTFNVTGVELLDQGPRTTLSHTESFLSEAEAHRMLGQTLLGIEYLERVAENLKSILRGDDPPHTALQPNARR